MKRLTLRLFVLFSLIALLGCGGTVASDDDADADGDAHEIEHDGQDVSPDPDEEGDVMPDQAEDPVPEDVASEPSEDVESDAVVDPAEEDEPPEDAPDDPTLDPEVDAEIDPLPDPEPDPDIITDPDIETPELPPECEIPEIPDTGLYVYYCTEDEPDLLRFYREVDVAGGDDVPYGEKVACRQITASQYMLCELTDWGADSLVKFTIQRPNTSPRWSCEREEGESIVYGYAVVKYNGAWISLGEPVIFGTRCLQTFTIP